MADGFIARVADASVAPPRRAKRTFTIADMQRIAADKPDGGECLSSAYVNIVTPLRWRCARGHEWEARPSNVVNGTWCPHCSYVRSGERQLAAQHAGGVLNRLRDIAASRGGECLADEYTGNTRPHPFRCAAGHEFRMRPDVVKRGGWCRTCSGSGHSAGERLTRAVLEDILGVSLPQTRPAWLKIRRRPLELDGLNEAAGIAFEYQGGQHYGLDKRVQGTALSALQERDTIKAGICAERGVRLIVVPYFPEWASRADNIALVRAAVKVAGFAEPAGWTPGVYLLEISDPLALIFGQDGADRLRRIVADRGGELLSASIPNAKAKLRLRCAAGHEWGSLAEHIRRGFWCATCSGNNLKSLAEMQEWAAARGGECVSAVYLGMNEKLRWRCEAGHEWETRPACIKRGHWCRRCHIEKGQALLRPGSPPA